MRHNWAMPAPMPFHAQPRYLTRSQSIVAERRVNVVQGSGMRIGIRGTAMHLF
jgi:hypothetical protein